MTLTFEVNMDSVELNHRAIYQDRRYT